MRCCLLLLRLCVVVAWRVAVSHAMAWKPRDAIFQTTITPAALSELQYGAQQGNADTTYLYAMVKLYGHGVDRDVPDAVKMLKTLANSGHRDAEFVLGMLYASGEGVGSNDRLAASWLSASANRGHSDAQWMLATMYNHGRGVAINIPRALELLEQSAQDGNAHALFHLGVMYEYGRGVPKNSTHAAALFAQASTQRVPDATYHLALMHLQGRILGKPVDSTRATQLLHEAADLQHAPALFMLGRLCVDGAEGVPIDYVQAREWFRRAAELNDPRVSSMAATAAAELDALLVAVDMRIREQEVALGVPIRAAMS
ncbi:TPA: hypothetical protein N0F65_005946 [Lagenidium giganteum]|uniref:Uncharacterized protein n=1 Tax=Lagenidium giganteum TaxID=4803 RepID=A0AAV2ZA82_9STRA|nr:TPA: hypothetical protein N0F65_005946 [Lagenidium giganteum]